MTLALTPEQERRLTAYAKQRQKPVERVIEDWIQELPEEIEEEDAKPIGLQEQFASEEEFEKWMDELAEMGRDWGSLPDSAFDRENLYQDVI
jgi:hypothetical protein